MIPIILPNPRPTISAGVPKSSALMTPINNISDKITKTIKHAEQNSFLVKVPLYSTKESTVIIINVADIKIVELLVIMPKNRPKRIANYIKYPVFIFMLK